MVELFQRVWLWVRGVLDAAVFPGLLIENCALVALADDDDDDDDDESPDEIPDEDPEVVACSCTQYGEGRLPAKVEIREARKIIWDMVACGEVREYYGIIGIPSESQEVSDMEHRASHRRLLKIAPYLPYIHRHCLVSSLVMTESAMLHAPDRQDQGLRMRLLTGNYEEHFTVAVALVSNLLDQGLITGGVK